jgi:hypothetical protein
MNKPYGPKKHTNWYDGRKKRSIADRTFNDTILHYVPPLKWRSTGGHGLATLGFNYDILPIYDKNSRISSLQLSYGNVRVTSGYWSWEILASIEISGPDKITPEVAKKQLMQVAALHALLEA